MRLIENSVARNIFNNLKESESIPSMKDEDFNETVLRDFRLFLMDKYGDELYKDVTDEDVNEYLTGMFYDIWDNDDLDSAEDIIKTEYHISDKSDFNESEDSEEFPLNKDDKDFKDAVIRDFITYLDDVYGVETLEDAERVRKNVTNDDINAYFTSLFYDIQDNDDFDTADVAEEIIRREFHVPDTSDFNESEDSERILAKLVKDLPDTVEYKGKTYQAFNVMSNDTTGATSKVYYCNMENTPNGDPQESNDYFFVVATLKKTDRGYKGVDHINYVEDLTEGVKVRESAKELFAYENGVKPEDIEERFEYRETINESVKNKKSTKNQQKEDKRVVMQQGNITCFKENDNTYYVFENENDNEVEHDNEESAMQDFMERVGIDIENELKEE